MATQLTTSRPSRIPPTAVDGAPSRPPLLASQPAALRSWAALDLDPHSLDHERPAAPVPTVVRLSRLIEPAPMTVIDPEPLPPVIDLRRAETSGPRSGSGSLGRPLFQLGLAAMLAATAIGIVTFAPASRQNLSAVEPTPLPADAEWPTAVPGSPAPPIDDGDRQGLIARFGAQQSTSIRADLAVVGTATSDGDTIRWTATIRNLGPDVADQPIRLIHTLPNGLELVSSAGDAWDCRFTAETDSVTCDLSDDLAVGQRRQLGIVTTDGEQPAGASLPSTMTVIGRNADNDLANNTISVVAVVAESDDDQSERSRSTGDLSTDDGGSTGSTGSSVGAGAATEELPRTGAGLTAVLATAGMAMCLAGRRLLRLSADHRPIAIEARLG